VVKSSGHALLDEAAERATMGFGYSPASTAGINEAARVIVPFVF
jgi:outer membrane biosynthesis protein TonB